MGKWGVYGVRRALNVLFYGRFEILIRPEISTIYADLGPCDNRKNDLVDAELAIA